MDNRHPHSRHPHRRGFTLIELLAATALLAMFMLTAASVTAALGRTRHNMQRDAERSPYLRHPLQTLERDLANARVYKFNGPTLTLLGYGLLHSRNLQPLHLPAEVTYTLRSDGHTTWLIRTQRSANPLATQHRMTQPLIADLAGATFEFTPGTKQKNDNTEPSDSSDENTPENNVDNIEADAPIAYTPGPTQPLPADPLLTRRGFEPIPSHVRLTLRYAEGNRPAERRSFYPRR
ncbi:MAG: PulJ/GspJ family protein [Planctomycetota bacterium]|jgi:prepilin-type N-terminal cleavage/methylation domain-containing protein